MKKIFVLYIVLLMLIMSACSSSESSKRESVSESSISETSGQTVETTEKVTKTETVQTETTPIETIQKAERLNLGKVDEWNFNSRSKFIYFTDNGCYYSVETSGLKNGDNDDACLDIDRHLARYALCLDTGNAEPTILSNTENYESYYCDGNSIYIYKYDELNNKDGIYKIENGNLTAIKEFTDYGYISTFYFTSNYIYFCKYNEKNSEVYRMDYEGNNVEHIFNNANKIWNIAIYNGKIWYEHSCLSYQMHRLAYYDMEKGEAKEFENGSIGLINNNFMYYKDLQSLYRINLSNYKCESIFKLDNDKYLSAFDFYGDYILYSSGSSIYKLSDNENTLIFSPKDFFDKKYNIEDIQCQDNRIFIKITSGPFYQYLAEIDINGNLIKTIHEG